MTEPVRNIVTTLEMRAAPNRPSVPRPAGRYSLMRADPPGLAFYRFLYNTVGADWFWIDRRAMPDAELLEIIRDPKVEVYVLYAAGTPAGFAELDRRVAGETELAFFGLMPDAIGQGLGWYLLNWAIERAWETPQERLWVHTCDKDHPRALALYQRAGFQVIGQDEEIVDDKPRLKAIAELRKRKKIALKR